MPFTWNPESEVVDFDKYIDGGKLTSLPIIQIILARGTDQIKDLLQVTDAWDFERVIPMHLDAPVVAGPKELREALKWVDVGRNLVRFCDEDVKFLRSAEEGILNFSVYKTPYGVLRGRDGDCGLI
jgi:L-ascorbate metabolism protein UlaG (beta-lactamase superfamily)